MLTFLINDFLQIHYYLKVQKQSERPYYVPTIHIILCICVCVCAHVCMCIRDRKREKSLAAVQRRNKRKVFAINHDSICKGSGHTTLGDLKNRQKLVPLCRSTTTQMPVLQMQTPTGALTQLLQAASLSATWSSKTLKNSWESSEQNNM